MKHFLFKKFTPVFFVFILINILIFLFKNLLTTWGFNIGFLIGSNLLLFVLSLLAFLIQSKTVKSSNVNAFIRGIYSTVILKLFIIVIAVLIYILLLDGKITISSLFCAMVFYLIYTSVEVIQLMKLARRKTDA